MKITKVEVEVHSPNEMSDAKVSGGIDEMLDAGEASMVDEVFECACAHEIDPEIAQDCVELTVADSTVVESLENQPEHLEPPRNLIHLTALDDYNNPRFSAGDD